MHGGKKYVEAELTMVNFYDPYDP